MEQTPPNLETLIPASRVKQMFGEISDMTLWRWLNEAELGFPQPVRINGRRYWRTETLLEWIEEASKHAETQPLGRSEGPKELKRLNIAANNLLNGDA